MDDGYKRILGIDGLRGLCSIIVLMNHFVVAFYPAAYWGKSVMSHIDSGIDIKLSQSIFGVFYAGNFAVCIFFVISGFVIAINCFKGKDKKRVLVNRFGRLFFPVLIANFIYYIFKQVGLISTSEIADITGSEWLRGALTYGDVGVRDVFVDSYFNVMLNGSAKYNGVLWTISYLFLGTFLVALIVMMVEKGRNRWIIYTFSFLFIWTKGMQGTIIYNYLAAFIIGIVIADLYLNTKFVIKPVYSFIIIIIALLLGGYPIGIIPENLYRILNWGKRAAEFWHIIGAGLIIFLVIYNDRISKLFENKLIQFVGKISFSIFLFHQLIILSYSTQIFAILFKHGVSYSIAFLIVLITSIVIILIISYGSFLLIEKNVNKLLNIIYNKLFI